MGRNFSKISGGILLAAAGGVLFSTACNQYPVALVESSGAIEERIPVGGTEAQKFDILWMIDNSGSMCRSQEILRDGISRFVEILGEVNLDFHIGVTTTHLTEASVSEPVARSGQLQSTPQPLPGFDRRCWHPLDENGDPIRTDLTPVEVNVEVAVDCVANPEAFQHLRNPDPHLLRCALDAEYRATCNAADIQAIDRYFPPNGFCDPQVNRCQGEDTACTSNAQCTSAYREIPLVLRSEDYRDPSGAVDIDAFAADFSCMSLVGTRGWGYERGLGAVVKAISPEMTGGPDAAPGSAPNAGFLRSDSNLAVIFITDENDCTDDGTLNEQTTCDVAQCTVQENLGADGALIPVRQLRYDFMRNLAASKGMIEANEEPNYAVLEAMVGDSIVAASVHAFYQRDFQMNQDLCTVTNPVLPSCQTTFGVGWSGHRYGEFIVGFPTHFPTTDTINPETGLPDHSEIGGEICNPFQDTLEDIADLIRTEGGGCVERVYACDGPADDSCPNHAHTGEPGSCVPYPAYPAGSEDAEYYCDTGIEVRLANAPDLDVDLQRIEDTGYCMEGTLGTVDFPGSCVVDPVHYEWVRCDNNVNSRMTLEWQDPQWQQILDGLAAEARYARIPR